MSDESAWLDNSGDSGQRYDFFPPKPWTDERIVAEQAAIVALLEGLDGRNGDERDAAAPGWLRLAAGMPEALRHALVAELRAGNRLTGIGATGWPMAGSIVVNVRDRFTIARDAPPEGVTWRRLDDPHYAREELSAVAGPCEHLVIA